MSVLIVSSDHLGSIPKELDKKAGSMDRLLLIVLKIFCVLYTRCDPKAV